MMRKEVIEKKNRKKKEKRKKPVVLVFRMKSWIDWLLQQLGGALFSFPSSFLSFFLQSLLQLH
jgi:hypothetical protein